MRLLHEFAALTKIMPHLGNSYKTLKKVLLFLLRVPVLVQIVAKTRFQLCGRHDLDDVNGKTTLIPRYITPGLAVGSERNSLTGQVCAAPQEQPLSLSASSPRKNLHQPSKVS